MKYLPQLLIICLFSFLGEVCHLLIPAPLPASIYGMVLLFLALLLKIVPVRLVQDVGSFLTGFLGVLFVAPIVSLMDCWATIREHLLPIAVIILVSTLLVFSVSGWMTQFLLKRKGAKKDHV